MIKVKVEGLRECERALAELPKATGKNVLRRVARKRLEPMRDHAIRLAPDDPQTGAPDLPTSIKIQEVKAKRMKGSIRYATSTGISMRMGVLKTAFHGKFQEWGTVNMPANPFMRPAWDAGKMKLIEGLKDDLWSEISKAAARLAKKRAKAA